MQATPQARAQCPICDETVIAKCGDIVVWHWAHKKNDCDGWSEPEGYWHKLWKSAFPSDWQEKTIGNHRADICTPHGVIELQASSISPQEIRARENHYRKMVWVVLAERFRIEFYNSGDYYTFKWLWPHKSWFAATKPLFFDCDQGFFLIKKIHPNEPESRYHPAQRCRGWAQKLTEQEFIESWGGRLP